MHGLDSWVTLSESGLGQTADGSKCFSPSQSNLPPQVILAPFNTVLLFVSFLPFGPSHQINVSVLLRSQGYRLPTASSESAEFFTIPLKIVWQWFNTSCFMGQVWH